ncbi:hypothetical protein EDD85DRAFT_798549 [Armillaria nabsnona]|nr:hypothetical protein EDD85DRAFT_798543 [Armillaria nabsnona]KAK0215922.1 hypothetical protein EDD85DRAFT_798549 [Armillaria nabsnona]
MSTLFIVIAQSELVHWDASALTEVRACLVSLQSTLRCVLGTRNGILAVRILLGSIHFAHSHHWDTWLPCQSIEVSLNWFRLVLGRRLSARVYYNQDNHIDFNDELALMKRTRTSSMYIIPHLPGRDGIASRELLGAHAPAFENGNVVIIDAGSHDLD